MTGLASVFVLILIATMVFRYTSKEPSITAIGAARPEVVANMTDTASGNSTANEPLAELGVAPSATTDNASDAAAK